MSLVLLKMYGQIHCVVREMVQVNYGQEQWTEILKQSAMDEDTDFMMFSVYEDPCTLRLFHSVSIVLGMPFNDILHKFGAYFLTYLMKYGYDKMLRSLGQDLFSFIHNLDSLHSMLSLSYKGIVSPSFRCQNHDDGTLTLHYYSWRNGFYPFVEGLLEAVGRQLFQQETRVTMMNMSTVEVEKGLFHYHTSMKVAVKWASSSQADQAMATRVSVTQTDYSVESADAGAGTASLVSVSDLCQAFPYHIVMDQDLHILQCGHHIRRLVPSAITPTTHLSHIAVLKQPRVSPTPLHIQSFINSIFIIHINRAHARKPFPLKGQMMRLPHCGHLLFMGSPRLQSLNDMRETEMFMADIPLYDVTRELVLLNQQRLADIAVAQQVDQTMTALKNTSRALEQQKCKVDELLYELMPEKVARQLKEKGFVDAVRYAMTTVLFSGLETIADIVSTCGADDVVNVLNDLFYRFDACADRHRVYKIKTVGDAYMAVTGVPEVQGDHVERLAGFAMDMMEEANFVSSPATQLPLTVRVGLDSGSVVAGVIGKKKPRYDIYGDTVNTASRMVTHSVPGRIHVTEAVFKKLFKRGYVFKSRGVVDVKGKGKMTTYFLVGTLDRELDEPDDKFTFLPEIYNTTRGLDLSRRKLIKRKVTVIVPYLWGKSVPARAFSKVSNITQPISTPPFTSDVHTNMRHQVVQPPGNAPLPSHHVHTWDLIPSPSFVSASMEQQATASASQSRLASSHSLPPQTASSATLTLPAPKSQSPKIRVHTVGVGGQSSGTSISRRQQVSWDLRPSLSMSAGVGFSPDPVLKVPSTPIGTNHSSFVASLNKSQSSYQLYDVTHTDVIPSSSHCPCQNYGVTPTHVTPIPCPCQHYDVIPTDVIPNSGHCPCEHYDVILRTTPRSPTPEPRSAVCPDPQAVCHHLEHSCTSSQRHTPTLDTVTPRHDMATSQQSSTSQYTCTSPRTITSHQQLCDDCTQNHTTSLCDHRTERKTDRRTDKRHWDRRAGKKSCWIS